jgi:hypothetical protein
MKTISFNFSSNLNVRRIQYQNLLVKHAGFSYEETSSMSLAELRNEIDNLFPQVMTIRSLSRSGGTSVKTIVKKRS